MPSETTLSFQEDYHGCIDGLRNVLTELLNGAGVLHARPQELAREFKLNKNLAWKISKLVHETPNHETLSFIPGSSGFQIVLTAFAKHGLDSATLAKAEAAFQSFQDMVERHADDRTTLQLLIDSLAAQGGDGKRLEESRRLAYQGNSGILGIQARVRFASFFVAPNPENPDMLDTAFLGGLLGVRRFRPNASWPLNRHTSFNDDGSPCPMPNIIPLDPLYPGPGPTLIGDFCSKPTPEVRVRNLPRMEIYELAPGPIGNSGVADICIGHYTLGEVPRYRDEHNHFGEFHLFLSSPIETLQFDLVLHKDLDVEELLDPILALNFNQAEAHPQERNKDEQLPMPEKPRLLFGAKPAFSTPLVERYNEMTDTVFDRLHWKPEDFRAWRLELSYPPLPATLAMSFPLHDPPKE
ncbi:MAG: hypothetical protein GY747_04035 [Planctomycetes bacterium]|nr:hypothetical protein [Planctomycetota bacterium]MCP4771923.1 hypothetical protein [Planctomycetota bacterium]MCP4859968.1 hypothetical protein [Planctomycetota bacterium]